MGSLRRRQACVVLGMHRSGTSALANLLACLGADLPIGLNPPAPDNPEGYFESAALVAIHDELLRAGGSVWFDVKPFTVSAVPGNAARALMQSMAKALEADYSTAALPLIKDPRMCRFFPLSREVLAASGMECSVVLALRHPAEVAASLASRDQMSATYSGLLWARHVISSERDSRDLPRVTICYDDMMADWRSTAGLIRRLPGLWRASDPEQLPLKASLRHHNGLTAIDTFGLRLGQPLEALYSALKALADSDGEEQRARVDAIAADVLSASARETALLEAEFLHRRLSTANPFWRSSDPREDSEALAVLFDSLHASPGRDIR